jgi:hypothetical protein
VPRSRPTVLGSRQPMWWSRRNLLRTRWRVSPSRPSLSHRRHDEPLPRFSNSARSPA